MAEHVTGASLVAQLEQLQRNMRERHPFAGELDDFADALDPILVQMRQQVFRQLPADVDAALYRDAMELASDRENYGLDNYAAMILGGLQEAYRAALAASEAQRLDAERRAKASGEKHVSIAHQLVEAHDRIIELDLFCDTHRPRGEESDFEGCPVCQLAAAEARIRELETQVEAYGIGLGRLAGESVEQHIHNLKSGAVPSGEASGPQKATHESRSPDGDGPRMESQPRGLMGVASSSDTGSALSPEPITARLAGSEPADSLTHKAAAVLALTHGPQQDQQWIQELEARCRVLEGAQEITMRELAAKIRARRRSSPRAAPPQE